MTTIELDIAPNVAARFPETAVGIFVACDLDDRRLASADTAGIVRAAREALQAEGLTTDGLMRDPRVIDWRWAIGRCGLKASTFRGSAEQLGRRFLKSDAFTTPLAIVTAYCSISARRLAPLGAYDVDRLPSTRVALRTWREGDRYEPLYGHARDMPTSDDLVVYACEDEAISYAWNVRDSKQTCLVPETRRALFVGEAATPRQLDACRSALADLASWLAEHGARVSPLAFATADLPRVAAPLP